MSSDERVGLCLSCVNFIPAVNMCADRVTYMFPLEEPPEKHQCVREYRRAEEFHPTKQFSTKQFGDIAKTHYEIEFDSDGYMSDVHVRGRSRVPLEVDIPHGLLGLALYTSRYAEHCYDPTDKRAILIAHEQNRPFMTTVLKRWNWSGHPPKEPAHFKSEIHRLLGQLIREMTINKGGYETLVNTVDAKNFMHFVDFWEKMGYEGGVEQLDGISVPWVGYRRGDQQNHVYVPEITSLEQRQRLAKQVVLADTNDERFLSKFNLSTHCILCGYEYGNCVIPDVCTWCKMRTFEVVFKG